MLFPYEHRATLGLNGREFIVFVHYCTRSGPTSHIEEIKNGYLVPIEGEVLRKVLEEVARERGYLEFPRTETGAAGMTLVGNLLERVARFHERG